MLVIENNYILFLIPEKYLSAGKYLLQTESLASEAGIQSDKAYQMK